MLDKTLNERLNDFAGGNLGLTLTMSKDGCWLRIGLDQWPISNEQADRVLTAMRCQSVETRTTGA